MLKPVDDDGETGSMSGRLKTLVRFAGPAIAVALIAAATFVLWEVATTISFADVERAIGTMAPWRIAVALVCTVLGVCALASYDALATRVVRSRPPISLRRALIGGAISNIFANALGLPLLSGGSVRYRIYSMAGATLSVVARIVAMSWFTMWSGIFAVLGVFLLWSPETDAAAFGSHLADRVIGVALLAGLAGFVVWVGRRRRTMRVGGWTVRLPSAGIAVGMIGAGAFDLMTAAGALYVLLPADVVPDIGRYMVTYAVGLLAGILASTPGGLGVFEAAILTGLDVKHRPGVAAALVIFRVIYFVLPLLVALVALGAIEIRHRRARRITRAGEGEAVAPP